LPTKKLFFNFSKYFAVGHNFCNLNYSKPGFSNESISPVCSSYLHN
jgi:hypothetical protein